MQSSKILQKSGKTFILKNWHNFLTLRIEMKNVVIKIFAVLLLGWYSMSIIGFDVHTCNGSGRSFVVTFIKGFTCADIHPDHVCDKASCCSSQKGSCCHEHADDHSENGFVIKSKSCCSSDYQVLDLTGTLASNDNDHFDGCGCGHCPFAGFPVCEIPPAFHENKLAAYVHEPDSGVVKACERQAALRVWRI